MSPSDTARFRVWSADPLHKSRLDHLVELARLGVDPTGDRAYLDLTQVIARELSLGVPEAARHLDRIIGERAKK